MWRYYKYAAVFIFTLFCLSITPWAYNFPLNDDWAYAIGVSNLLSQGRFALCDWASATQLTHIISGAFFAKIFGFSFVALKAYNLAIAAALVLVFFKLLEEFEINPIDRLLAALVLCLNPLFIVLANSFMTDVTYMFWMTLSVYFYVRHLKTDERRLLLYAGLCSAAACLTRQLGLAAPLAWSLIIWWERRTNLKNLLTAWLFPLTAVFVYALWFRCAHGATWASENYVLAATLKHLSCPPVFVMNSFHRLFSGMMETGLLLLPLTAGYFYSATRFQCKNAFHKKITRGSVWLAAAVLACFALINGPLPYLENTFGRNGLGVMTLPGAQLKASAFFSSALFWRALTALSVFSAAILMCASGITLRAGEPAARFIFVSTFIHLGASLLGAKFFDRYLLTLLPWFIFSAVFCAKHIKFSRPAAVLTLALMAIVSWTGLKDYMQWNRAKWELASRPRPELDPAEIAAGFDHDAWLNYEKNMRILKAAKPLTLIEEWEWQKMIKYKARVSFSQKPGYAVMDSITYDTPLGRNKNTLYLLRAQ